MGGFSYVVTLSHTTSVFYAVTLKRSISKFLKSLKNFGNTQYYEEQNRELIARIVAQIPKPGTEAAWEKLRVAKAKRESKV